MFLKSWVSNEFCKLSLILCVLGKSHKNKEAFSLSKYFPLSCFAIKKMCFKSGFLYILSVLRYRSPVDEGKRRQDNLSQFPSECLESISEGQARCRKPWSSFFMEDLPEQGESYTLWWPEHEEGPERSFGDRLTSVWLLISSPTTCVLLEKSSDLSALHFLNSIALRLLLLEAA